MTDFEKLIIAKKYIEILKEDRSKLSIEKGQLLSEIEHLKYELERAEKHATKPPVIANLDEICNTSVYQRQLEKAKKLRDKNIKLEQEKNHLLFRLTNEKASN